MRRALRVLQPLVRAGPRRLRDAITIARAVPTCLAVYRHHQLSSSSSSMTVNTLTTVLLRI